jgi:hypothetical protein
MMTSAAGTRMRTSDFDSTRKVCVPSMTKFAVREIRLNRTLYPQHVRRFGRSLPERRLESQRQKSEVEAKRRAIFTRQKVRSFRPALTLGSRRGAIDGRGYQIDQSAVGHTPAALSRGDREVRLTDPGWAQRMVEAFS